MTQRITDQQPTPSHPSIHPADLPRSESDLEDDASATETLRPSVELADDVLADDYEDPDPKTRSGPPTSRLGFLSRFVPGLRRRADDYEYSGMPVHQRRGRPSR